MGGICFILCLADMTPAILSPPRLVHPRPETPFIITTHFLFDTRQGAGHFRYGPTNTHGQSSFRGRARVARVLFGVDTGHFRSSGLPYNQSALSTFCRACVVHFRCPLLLSDQSTWSDGWRWGSDVSSESSHHPNALILLHRRRVLRSRGHFESKLVRQDFVSRGKVSRECSHKTGSHGTR